MHGKAFALLTVCCMATLTLLMRAVLQFWPVGLAGTCSRVVTLAALGAFVFTTGRGWRRLMPNGAGAWLVLMGLFSIFVNLLLFSALAWTTATNHALLYRLDTVFVVLIGGLLGLERASWKELMLLPVMLLGMALVAEIGVSGFQVHLLGDLMVVGAAAGFAVNAFVNRQILRSMEPAAMAIYNVGASLLGFVILALVGGELARAGDAVRSPSAWLLLVLLGLIVAVFVPTYYATLNRMAVWRLRAWMLAVPLLVAIADWLLWDTRLTGRQSVGAGLLLVGLAAMIRLERHGGFFRSLQVNEADAASRVTTGNTTGSSF